MLEKTCGDCCHWEQTGIEDSGILAIIPGTGNWFYRVGKCKNPVRILGTYAGGDKQNIPEFVTFWCFKKRRCKAKSIST